MPRIHPTAVISPEAELSDDCEIGPYTVIEGPVRLGPGVRIAPHAHLVGPLEIGARSSVWSFACVGLPPQDYKFGIGHETAGVKVGSDTIIREHATIHAATNNDRPTTVGNNVFLMGMTHVAHDCVVGDNVIFVNYAGIAGHAQIGDGALLSGQALVHQHTRVGRLAMMSGGTGVSADVPPFCVVNERQRMGGVNRIGMRRSGMDASEVNAVRRAFTEAFKRTLPRGEMLEILDRIGAESPAVAEMAAFVRSAKRPICPGPSKPPRMTAHLGTSTAKDAEATPGEPAGAVE
ncbi:MAG: acyl-ACP--UDP-N-acetylglucosamine O-acyltransferase [Planctomycetota bacterium]